MIKIKLDVKPMNKVKFLKDKEVPQGTTKDDYTFVYAEVGKKKEMVLVGAKYAKMSDDEIIATLFKTITEALYERCKPIEVEVDGEKRELTQIIQ